MKSTINTFDFDSGGVSLRAIDRGGQPWFLARDICAALDIQNVSQAIAEVEPDDKQMFSIGLPGRSPWLVTEAGLYLLILRSRKPEAKNFQRWVTRDVLPTIRKDGLYIANQEKPITDDLTLPGLLAQMTEIQAKVDAFKARQVMAWSRHQEEKRDRYHALRFMR